MKQRALFLRALATQGALVIQELSERSRARVALRVWCGNLPTAQLQLGPVRATGLLKKHTLSQFDERPGLCLLSWLEQHDYDQQETSAIGRRWRSKPVSVDGAEQVWGERRPFSFVASQRIGVTLHLRLVATRVSSVSGADAEGGIAIGTLAIPLIDLPVGEAATTHEIKALPIAWSKRHELSWLRPMGWLQPRRDPSVERRSPTPAFKQPPALMTLTTNLQVRNLREGRSLPRDQTPSLYPDSMVTTYGGAERRGGNGSFRPETSPTPPSPHRAVSSPLTSSPLSPIGKTSERQIRDKSAHDQFSAARMQLL